MDLNRQIREWLKQQLEEYQITPGQLSVLVDGLLSEMSVRNLLDGLISWTSIPKDTKRQLIPKLEAALGPLPREAQPQTMFRPTDVQAPAPTLTDEQIQSWLDEIGFEEPHNPSADAPRPPIKPARESFFSEDTVTGDQDISGGEPLDKFPQSDQEMQSSEREKYVPIIEYCSRCQRPITDDTKPCPNCKHPCDRSH
jgi:hypothetical protein